MDKIKNYIGLIIVSVAIVFSTFLAANAFKNRNSNNDTINVTGLGSKDFESDLIVWNSSFTKKSTDLKTSVGISKDFDRTYDEYQNVRSEVFTGYTLKQNVQVESKEVEEIENISRQVTELINSGVELYSDQPEYYYTKLAELKLQMIAEATKDAKLRAEKIAENAGAKLGDLKKSEMGVFQIIAQNSSEDYSWGGSFNTSSKKKTANITMKLSYNIR